MNINAVEVINLEKSYPGIKAVDDISFSVKEGEIFGLLGPNGAGKTTTIRMLLTLVLPTSGTINIFGINNTYDPGKVRQMAGYVPQDVSVDGELTGYENMLMYAKLYDVPRKTRKNMIKDALEYMDLSDRAGDMVKNYSGGMMRRLEIAQALVNHPKLLYLDEPSIGLDPNARRIIWEHVERLRREFGTTIFITTHDMNEADRLCHRIGIMNHGKLATVGEPSKLKAAIGGDIISIGSKTSKAFQKIGNMGYNLISDPADEKIEIVVNNGDKQIPAILESFHKKGVIVNSVSLKKPALDDVFVHFTGSHIDQNGSFAQARRTRRKFRRLN